MSVNVCVCVFVVCACCVSVCVCVCVHACVPSNPVHTSPSHLDYCFVLFDQLLLTLNQVTDGLVKCQKLRRLVQLPSFLEREKQNVSY